MIQWIVFDPSTAARIAGHLSSGASLKVESGDALQCALKTEAAVSLVLLPSGKEGKVLLARLEQKSAAAGNSFQVSAPEEVPRFALITTQEPAQAIPFVTSDDSTKFAALEEPVAAGEQITYEAGGFLGLSDEPVFQTDYEPKPLKWWQRIWN